MPHAPAPAPRSTYHHGDLKNALVQAGIAMLEEGGLPALSLRALAARVGVSHTAPKNHFGSLRGLLTAIAAEAFRRHAAFMRDGLAPDATPEARLRAAMTGYARFARTHPHLFALMFSDLHCDMTDPALQAAGAESYGILQDVAHALDWTSADGAPASPRQTEMMLWSFVHGYAVLSQTGLLPAGPGGAPAFAVTEIMPAFHYGAGADAPRPPAPPPFHETGD